jgi:predicted CXXCH cytochrome family protein
VVLAEYPLKYVVGSGRHGFTYLVETDGFLVESPRSWYAARKQWDISPGYDAPNQPGFGRPIIEGCLFCHAGQSEALEGSPHRIRISETTIGCERCHGPGALHVERQTDGQRAGGKIDPTIVNPAHLPRELAEAICQQCHLHSDVAVTIRGRKLTDFRPGLRFEEFREVFDVKATNQAITVVGHVEQLHLSRCYQATNSFSCLTCHDPHGKPAPEKQVAHYQAICVSCHRLESCTVSAARREKESPKNDCTHCHMPRSPTEVAHVAFTHHRVGIHERRPPANGEEARDAGELQAFLTPPALSDIDRQMALGRAYRILAGNTHDGHGTEYQARALKLLTAVQKAGLRNADLEAALADLSFTLDVGEPLAHAERALALPNLANEGRCEALSVKAHVLARRGDHADALAAFRELTQLRRHAMDWMHLGNSAQATGDAVAADAALKTAVRINPRLWDVHDYLAQRYRRDGDAVRAAWHQQRALP